MGCYPMTGGIVAAAVRKPGVASAVAVAFGLAMDGVAQGFQAAAICAVCHRSNAA
jgi:hypothetical protein